MYAFSFLMRELSIDIGRLIREIQRDAVYARNFPEPRRYMQRTTPRIAVLVHRCIRPLRIGSIVARVRWKRRRFVQSLRAA